MLLLSQLSTSKSGQGINFWGSSRVLWVFPWHNVKKDQKSYENLLTAAKETRPFAAPCKKDRLEWLRVPRWPFAIISTVTQKKKNQNKTKKWIALHRYRGGHRFESRTRLIFLLLWFFCQVFFLQLQKLRLTAIIFLTPHFTYLISIYS